MTFPLGLKIPQPICVGPYTLCASISILGARRAQAARTHESDQPPVDWSQSVFSFRCEGEIVHRRAAGRCWCEATEARQGVVCGHGTFPRDVNRPARSSSSAPDTVDEDGPARAGFHDSRPSTVFFPSPRAKLTYARSRLSNPITVDPRTLGTSRTAGSPPGARLDPSSSRPARFSSAAKNVCRIPWILESIGLVHGTRPRGRAGIRIELRDRVYGRSGSSSQRLCIVELNC